MTLLALHLFVGFLCAIAASPCECDAEAGVEIGNEQA